MHARIYYLLYQVLNNTGYSAICSHPPSLLRCRLVFLSTKIHPQGCICRKFKHKGNKWFYDTLFWNTHFGWCHYCFVIQNTAAKLTYFKTAIQWFVTRTKCYNKGTNLKRYVVTFNGGRGISRVLGSLLLDTASFI